MGVGLEPINQVLGSVSLPTLTVLYRGSREMRGASRRVRSPARVIRGSSIDERSNRHEEV